MYNSNFIFFFFIIMKYPIKGFPLYHFDAEKRQVSKETKKWEQVLKPYLYKNGLERVTLYREHNPYYAFLKNFELHGKEFQVMQGKKFDNINWAFSKEKLGSVLTKAFNKVVAQDQEAKDLDRNEKNLKDFFEARENKAIRKDAFLKKFSAQVLTAYEDILLIGKTEKGIFICLK